MGAGEARTVKTLLNDVDAEEMLRRIHALAPDTRPRWGRMRAAQMLAHCQAPILVALGERRMRRTLLGILVGRWVKKKVLGPEPFAHDLPTDKGFLVRDERDFAIEKANLLAAIQRLRQGGTAGIVTLRHPFFGPMTPEEWERLLWKHLDHHLQQFGA